MKQSTNKNSGPFLAFTEEWFVKNQRILLVLLNANLTKRLFRYILRILPCDIALSERIVYIGPNRFSYGRKILENGQIEQTTDFRTHPKFGKRIYYAFKPLWWTIHTWDSAIADRFMPALSYGFSTLTAYPGVNNPVDGWARYSDSQKTWATVIAGSGLDADYTSTNDAGVFIQSDTISNRFTQLRRYIYCFDTSSLTSSATISSAIFSLFGLNKSDGLSATPTINVYASTPASTSSLASGDYSQVGSTALCDTALTYAGWSTSAYNDFTLNATGTSNISLTGISKFGTRNANYDVAATQPNWVSDSISRLDAYFANQTGTSNDPKLVVTYTAPTNWTKTVTDTTTTTASVLKGLTRIISNTITTTASASAVRTAVKTVLDTITTSTSILKSITKVFANTITNTASVNKGIDRVISTSVTTTAIVSKGATKVVLDTISALSPIGQLIIRLNGTVQDLIWSRISKHTSSWTNATKNTSSWTNKTKNTSTWTNQNKS